MNTITTQDFKLLRATHEVMVLDIRYNGAFNGEHLAKSRSMPITTLPNHLDTLSKQHTYYIMSHSGRRARVIAEFLNKQAFDAVAVIGGMKAFRQINVA